MTTPTDEELAALGAAFDQFGRRYKLAGLSGPDKPLNELDKLVLFTVGENDGCGPTDVARALGVAGTTVSSATDRLVKRGLLARERIEEDRRAVSLRLTPAGRARVDALLATYRDLHRHMLAPLTSAERRQLIAMLTKIVRHDA